MSLINDALKKAQKQRTGESPVLHTMPGVGGEPAARIAKRNKPIGFNSLLSWIAISAGSVLVLLIGIFFIVRWFSNRPATPPTATPAIVAQTTPASPSPAEPVVSTASPAIPVVATSAPAEASVPVVETPKAPEPEAAKPVAKMDPRAVAFIEALRVAGIRASATDAKVLMNDRVYRIGDNVEHQLGIKLAAITLVSLTFEDENGARYTRNF